MKNKLQQLINFSRGSKGLQQSVLIIGGNVLTTGMSAIALMLMSRILGPEKFGEFSVGFALVLILVRINDFGLTATVLKHASQATEIEKQNLIFSLTISYKLVATAVIAILGFVISPIIIHYLNFPNPKIIYLAFFISAATVYYEHYLAIFQSTHRFTQVIYANGIQAGGKLIGALLMLILSVKSSTAAFTWYSVAPGLVLLFSKKLLPHDFNFKFSLVLGEVGKKIVRMAAHTSFSLVASGIIENVDVFFVQGFLNTFETGLLGGVNRIAMLFSLIAYSLGNVLYSRAAKYQTKQDLANYLKKSTLVMLAAFGLFFLFLPFAKLAVILTIGPAYLGGMNVLNILVASQCLAIASVPFIALFYSYEADWYFSVSGLLQLIVVIAGNAIFVPIYGLQAAAWTRLATRMVLFLFTVITGLIIYYLKYVKKNNQDLALS